jgi:hypothetical protein
VRKLVRIISVIAVCLLILSISQPAYALSSILKFGSRGEEVAQLQKLLNERAYLDHEPTGYFGALTAQAVINFQLDYGLKVDGIAGPETYGALTSADISLPVKDDSETGDAQTETPETGEYLDWFEEAQYIFKESDIATVTDVDTRLTFQVMRTFGHEHADVETVTEKDTAILKSIWGDWSWERRAVIVSVNDRHIAASLTAMPHAGKDDAPALEIIPSRSGGYGRGTNLDLIKGNDMDGVLCMHFKNSNLHKDNKSDAQHQDMVKKAAGL